MLESQQTDQRQAAALPAPLRRSPHLRRLLRAANEELADRAGTARTVALVCECDDLGCSSAVEIPAQIFRVVLARPRFHVVRPGHEVPLVERVVRRENEYAVVEGR